MNKIISQAYAVCQYRFRYRIWNKRFFYTGLAFWVLIYLIEEGIRRFAIAIGEKVVPCVFPFLSSDWIFQMIITGYFVWLISSINDGEKTDLNIKARSGSISWKLGNCMAIIQTACVYIFFLIVSSAIIYCPYIKFENSWGIVWSTLAKTDASKQYGVEIIVNPIILHMNSPVAAFAKSVVLQFLCLCWLGLMIYTVNFFTKKYFGNYLAIALILLDTLLANTSNERFYRFSPITLVQLGNYSMGSAKYGICFGNSVIFYCIGILVCISICFVSFKRSN